MTLRDRVEGCFVGFAVGDALGVPFEFNSREALAIKPVSAMWGHGTWHQPRGTWSDDSSLSFCLAESLCNGYNLDDIALNCVRWMQEGYWGAHHKVFDIGGTTRLALTRLAAGVSPKTSGESDVDSNGNGSLMRIAPASIYFRDSPDNILLERMSEISGITHRHFRSVFSCFIFSKIAQKILLGFDLPTSYRTAITEIRSIESKDELKYFSRILDGSLPLAEEASIRSSGYVIHTLEASLWCLLNSTSYRDAVMKAVNLGEDTDTTGCVTGALAGLFYGKEAIPDEWKSVIARQGDISDLVEKFYQRISHLG
ncbi:MAG TPA: ADP-ribosylglycohydrolase family protein [Cyclobacteriaceae bacterium]|nr:ADP-ribosylglycohydrolase family protein [Cyclobacteriaceae bacterium]